MVTRLVSVITKVVVVIQLGLYNIYATLTIYTANLTLRHILTLLLDINV